MQRSYQRRTVSARAVSSFTGNKTSRSNEIQCLRCTRRAQRVNGTVQGDILIKEKVCLLFEFATCYIAMRKRRYFDENTDPTKISLDTRIELFCVVTVEQRTDMLESIVGKISIYITTRYCRQISAARNVSSLCWKSSWPMGERSRSWTRFKRSKS